MFSAVSLSLNEKSSSPNVESCHRDFIPVSMNFSQYVFFPVLIESNHGCWLSDKIPYNVLSFHCP